MNDIRSLLMFEKKNTINLSASIALGYLLMVYFYHYFSKRVLCQAKYLFSIPFSYVEILLKVFQIQFHLSGRLCSRNVYQTYEIIIKKQFFWKTLGRVARVPRALYWSDCRNFLCRLIYTKSWQRKNPRPHSRDW